METEYYSEHFHCYVVSKTDTQHVMTELCKFHPHPLHIRFINDLNSATVVPKYNIFVSKTLTLNLNDRESY